MENKQQPQASYIGFGVVLGIGIGTAFGVATDNLAVWIALGAGLGVVFGIILNNMNNRRSKSD